MISHRPPAEAVETVWIVRHGERQDYVDPAWKKTATNLDDSPLAELGHKQAKEVAARLKNERIDHIFSSPFLRCVQTANHIAEAVRKSVKIENGICEILWTFPPGYNDCETLKARFPCVDDTYRSAVVPHRRERYDADCFGRVGEAASKICQCFSGSILFVAHGASIAGLLKFYTGTASYVGLCTITKLQKTSDGQWQVELLSDSTHLSDRTNLRAY
ncbi:unnamed protein product [Soboliphyme baturini]|uniref:Phosphoglycerate mutase family protein n=1 Tax=Soboliphyme baturini TaxID=241478 RepID=A0A183I8S4_9BILA|nr:unnamed protein product [Soboliphyme baturini]